MSRDDAADGELVDEGDDDTKLYVADPDDYAKTRKLKALADAKERVRKQRDDWPDTASPTEWEALHQRLSEAVAMYGTELMPLLDEAERNGTLVDDDFWVEDMDVRNFVHNDGLILDNTGAEVEKPHPVVSMRIFRHLQKLERKLGLGLDLTAEQDDEWDIEV